MAFCDEIKAYLIRYVRSGHTYTVNGTVEMIKEIGAQLKDERLEITFRMSSSYFDDVILKMIELLGGKYVIKGKGCPTFVARVTDLSTFFVASAADRKIAELLTAINTWREGIRFVFSRVLIDEKDRKQLTFLEDEVYDYVFFINNDMELSSEEVVKFYENMETVRTISRKPNMIWQLDTCCSNHFGPMKRTFS